MSKTFQINFKVCDTKRGELGAGAGGRQEGRFQSQNKYFTSVVRAAIPHLGVTSSVMLSKFVAECTRLAGATEERENVFSGWLVNSNYILNNVKKAKHPRHPE